MSLNFSRRISDLLIDSGHNQSELAQFLGVQPSTVSAWIVGKSTPTYEKLESIARYFRLSVSELLADDPPRLGASSAAFVYVTDQDDIKNIPRGSSVLIEIGTVPAVGDLVLYKDRSGEQRLRRIRAYRDKMFVLMSDNYEIPPEITKDDYREIVGTVSAVLLKTKKEAASFGRVEAVPCSDRDSTGESCSIQNRLYTKE